MNLNYKNFKWYLGICQIICIHMYIFAQVKQRQK